MTMFRIFLYLCDDNNPKTPIIFKIQKNNKAAGTRARKSALELSKLMKEFRKVSVEAAK